MTTPTVAGPRRPISHEAYTGGELEMRSPRAGAYDALKLPSRMGDRLVEPGGPRPSLPSARAPQPVPLQHRTAPAAPPAPPPARAPAAKAPTGYRPRNGSVPSRVLEALALPDSGGFITFRDIGRRFGLPQKQVLASFATALQQGVLKRAVIDGESALALPHVRIVNVRPPADPAPAGPSVDVLAATREAWRQPFDPAAMQRFADTTAALGAALAQLEQQALVVVQAMGEALKAWQKAEASMNKKTGPRELVAS